MITITLTEKQYKKLMEALEDCANRGPSDEELSELRLAVGNINTSNASLLLTGTMPGGRVMFSAPIATPEPDDVPAGTP